MNWGYIMGKHRLTISSDWLPDWTYVEGVREIFQNALDNQIETSVPLFWDYNPETMELRVGNESTGLDVNTLLIGKTSKRNDSRTIGRHGEGYKGAIMVLLREGKQVTIHNYGKKELWSCRMVKAKAYASPVPEVDIKPLTFFNKPKTADLVFVIGNITKEEYAELVVNNLNLQGDYGKIEVPDFGCTILTDPKHSGNIYIEGLYITNKSKMNLVYGYNFKPDIISLDRDRQMTDTIDIGMVVSRTWLISGENDLILELLRKKALDVEYFTSAKRYADLRLERIDDPFDLDKVENPIEDMLKSLEDAAYEDFITEHGEDAYPVTSTEQIRFASTMGYTPVTVTNSREALLKPKFEGVVKDKLSHLDRLELWFDRVQYIIPSAELEEGREIVRALRGDTVN